MINGLGVLGWGVGGIEAEAAMLGQPVSMLVPQVVGFKLIGKLREGSTATDLVLTVAEMLRKFGVVGKFVEFCGPGISKLRWPTAPQSGIWHQSMARLAQFFRRRRNAQLSPSDRPQRGTDRIGGRVLQGAGAVPYSKFARGKVLCDPVARSGICRAERGRPRRPQDRVRLSEVAASFKTQLPMLKGPNPDPRNQRQVWRWDGEGGHPAESESNSAKGSPEPGRATSVKDRFGVEVDKYLDHGSIVIAAITSCTNTSNPSVMLAAGLLAKKAVERGLQIPPWVKSSLAPGSRVVTSYLDKAGLTPYLNTLRFHIVGYGCTTCIGNSGPLPPDVAKAIDDHGLVAVSVLSGNRNFEGRINSDVRANYLMSPPLVVAYALAGRIDHDFDKDPLGKDQDGRSVYLRDIWPSQREIQGTLTDSIDPGMFRKEYSSVSEGDTNWQNLWFPTGRTYDWEASSTYIRKAPYFEGMQASPAAVEDIQNARVLAVLGDSVTTDHISPAGSIKLDSPAGRYLTELGVKQAEFNSYGSRRGNHEVMVRGTFANVRLRNKLAPGTEGGVTRLLPEGEPMSIFDAAICYAARKTPLFIVAGKEYGSGSSRDWAAKGVKLLGVCAVIAESFERIHRSNLVGMGVLPLQFETGQNFESIGLTGEEVFEIAGLRRMLDTKFADGRSLTVKSTASDGQARTFTALVRIDTLQEILYYQHGGILQIRASATVWEFVEYRSCYGSTGDDSWSVPSLSCRDGLNSPGTPRSPQAEVDHSL